MNEYINVEYQQYISCHISVHTAVQTIPDTFHIYDTYKHSGINQEIQVSTSTDTTRECRLRPRVKVDKISKWFIF